MSKPCGQSELECEIIKQQIERRLQYRCEFLRMRTDPCLHSRESGFVFDPAVQRFQSMKCTQFEHFNANPRTALKGIFLVVIPMFTYGYLIWKDRTEREELIRCGKIKYKDRLFKLQ